MRNPRNKYSFGKLIQNGIITVCLLSLAVIGILLIYEYLPELVSATITAFQMLVAFIGIIFALYVVGFAMAFIWMNLPLWVSSD